MTLDQQCWQASGKYGPPTYTQEYADFVSTEPAQSAANGYVNPSLFADINHRAKVASFPKMMLHPKGAPRLVIKY
jgi:hypothetical protein